jgi:hypothetical protein
MRDKIGAGTLSAVLGAAAATLVGVVTKSVSLSAAIIGAAVAIWLLAEANAAQPGRAKRLYFFGSLVSLVTAVSVPVLVRIGQPDPQQVARSKEARVVASLTAGQDFSRFAAILGTPDTKRSIGQMLLYQFERPYETLQALVNQTGTVISYGIYTKSPRFTPQLGSGLITLNTTLLGKTGIERDTPVSAQQLSGANGYCGAHKAGYFQSFGGYNAVGARYYVLGTSNSETSEIQLGGLCQALGESGCSESAGNSLSQAFLQCVDEHAQLTQVVGRTQISVYIETAPGQPLLLDMLYPPDEAAVL